jgi:hypothetical protein
MGMFNGKITISRTTLKIIAIVSMLIDHMGFIIFPEVRVFRWIGRLAFPIFVYQLIEGFEKTSNVKKYLERLILFAFVSEIPFNLAFFNTPFYAGHQNVYFELAICLLTLVWLKKINESLAFIRWIVVFFMCTLAILIKADYLAFGVLLTVLFYLHKDNIWVCAIGWVALSYLFIGLEQLFSLLALPFLILYQSPKRKTVCKPTKMFQLSFYLFYPAHLIILYFIKSLFFK